jgi:hypothetical protein
MNRRCQNCGKPLLKSDDKCYHCNTPVPEFVQDEHTESTSKLSNYVRYILFILLLMVIGLYLMSWMGKNIQAPSSILIPETSIVRVFATIVTIWF